MTTQQNATQIINEIKESAQDQKITAREQMEALNPEAKNLQFWIRTQKNAPAQEPWFSAAGANDTGKLASGQVGKNQLKALPYRWRWSDYRPYLEKISQIAAHADVAPVEFADRQSIVLMNPGLTDRIQVTNTIRCSISIYNPGDIAPAHVHSPNASRTILTDNGGYTNIEGERCEARRGDVILTPNGTWHDHGNDGEEPVIWIDTLDWPLMEYLDCAWVDQDFQGAFNTTDRTQPVRHVDGYSQKLYSNGGLRPTFVSHQRGFSQRLTPLFHYAGTDIRDTLLELKDEAGDPFEGIHMELVNPVTGESVFPTLRYGAQLLRPHEATQLKRETSSQYLVVLEGEGYTEVNGQKLDWKPNDVIAVPNFLWRRHVNTSDKDAILYSVSDAALMKNIGQYRAQGKDRDGKVIQIEV
ncbi:MAG: cupin domain-containing protein [Actinomycetota bacterium]|nr:MAG: cupin domain-containing protein [Actinomycetota bacterium]